MEDEGRRSIGDEKEDLTGLVGVESEGKGEAPRDGDGCDRCERCDGYDVWSKRGVGPCEEVDEKERLMLCPRW